MYNMVSIPRPASADPWREERSSKWRVDKSPVAREYFVRKETRNVREVVHEKSRKCHITEMTSPPKAYLEQKVMDKDIMRKVLDTLKGYQVVARNDEDGLYYPGTVVKCTDARHAEVEFANKARKVISTRMIIASSGAIAIPPLRAGDYVLVQVKNPRVEMVSYVPGIVQVAPRQFEYNVQPKFYTVLMYNGQQVTAQRNSLFKISKVRFEFAIGYIALVQNQDREKIEENVYVQTPRKSSVEKPEPMSPDTSHLDVDRPENPTPASGRPVMVPSPGFQSVRSNSPSPVRSEELYQEKARSPSSSPPRSSSRSLPRSPPRSLPRSPARSPTPTPRSTAASVSDHSEVTKSPPSSRRSSITKVEDLRAKLENQQREHERQQNELREKYTKKIKKLKKKVKKRKKHDEVIVNVESDEDKVKEDEGQALCLQVTSTILEKRKSLPPLRKGEEVLARWSDEGWYFRGIVHQNCEDFSYIIEDSTGMCDKIWREDIITDYDDQDQIIHPRDPVIALHPNYNFSYAPGTVMEVADDGDQLHIKVRFYDGEENELTRDEVYKTWMEKFEHDVNFIVKCETRWVGQAVVARDDETGIYHLATVKERVGNGREYSIEFCWGTERRIKSINMFGVFTKVHPLAVGDRVLALANSEKHEYLPGWVRGIVDNKINIQFCNDEIKDIANDVMNFYWLSCSYYKYAVEYFVDRCQEYADSV